MPAASGGRSQQFQGADDLTQDLGGHLDIQGGSLEFFMPEQNLDDADIHPLFQPMGGETVQGVQRNPFFDLCLGGSHVTGAVELTGAQRVDRVLAGEQPAIG